MFKEIIMLTGLITNAYLTVFNITKSLCPELYNII